MKREPISKKLRAWRESNRLSMSEVSRRSMSARDPRGRITQGYISRLESGREENPSLLKLLTLCGIYKASSLDALIGLRKKS